MLLHYASLIVLHLNHLKGFVGLRCPSVESNDLKRRLFFEITKVVRLSLKEGEASQVIEVPQLIFPGEKGVNGPESFSVDMPWTKYVR